MKNSHLQFEPSLATKRLHRATRKAVRTIGNMIHSGLVHTASPHRDVAFMITAFVLEAVSLMLLWFKLPFGLGLVAGLATIDTAGAWLMHIGVGDRNWRAAEIGAASTAEEKAAIAAQRPWYFAVLRGFGMLLILGSLLFKVGSLLMLPHALPILGGFAPALMVAFFGVAAIHLFATGYAVAHLRYQRAENRDRRAMLRSEKFAAGRDVHENRIKAEREHRFVNRLNLVPVQHTDGHSLQLEYVDADENRHFLLITRGRLDDADVDFLCNGQKDALGKTLVCQEALRAQLVIEQTEPLTSSKPVMSDKALADPVLRSGPGAEAMSVRATVPSADTAMADNGSTPSASGTTRMVTMAVVSAFTLSLGGCGHEKPEPVKVSVVATKPLTRSATHLPESVLDLLAPPKPLAGKFVPLGEIVRLDIAGDNTESLAPDDRASGAQKALQAAWQIESAELELANSAESLRGRPAGITAKPAGDLDAAGAAKRLSEVVTTARKEGREVLAVSKATKNGALTIAPGVSVEARPTSKEACAFISERLKAGAEPSVLVLLDPPIFAEPASDASQPKPEKEANDDKRLAEDRAEPESRPETRIVPVPGSSNTIIFESNPPNLRLPGNARLVGEPIAFENGSARLTKTGRETLATIIQTLTAMGYKSTILVASADSQGSEPYNDQLANRRGQTVQAWLLERGISADLISTGKNLTPQQAPRDQLGQYRTVRVYVTAAAITQF